jgi:predicted Rossmann-fold nucleotide-binding protein
MNKNNPNPIRTELESGAAVQTRLNTVGATWHDVVIQSVDLVPVDAVLSKAALAGCHFLGCDVGPLVADVIAQSQRDSDARKHCLVFPNMPWLPFNPYRGNMYQAEELVGKFTSEDLATQKPIYEGSVDWKSYKSFADPADTRPFTNDSVDTVLARRLHDTSISDALDDLLTPIREKQAGAKKGIVAIMGGHDMLRLEKIKGSTGGTKLGDDDWEGMTDDSVYTRVALLAWKLSQPDEEGKPGYLLVSGGGPGAMEAANLGAYFASRTLADLRSAIKKLEDFKEFKSGKSVDWLIPAMKVRRDFPLSAADELKCQSVGIPTWSYGHEPPNPFATHIAKYFENSVREEGLLAIATHGVIFAEGNAGTVQEIFQDACQNYYTTYGTAAPMILFGQDYWDPPAMPVYVNDKRKKAFPLVRKLAEEKGFTHRLIVTDSLREIVKTIAGFKP